MLFKQKTEYVMLISDWRSDVFSDDLVGHEKGRAVVRKKADALEAFEGVAIEGLRSHFSFLCQSSGMQRLPLDFPLFIRNLLGGERTIMLYKGGPKNYSKGDWLVIKANVGIVDVASSSAKLRIP